MLTFGAIAARYRPRWLVWENVPGVLSSNGGRDFGTFLGMLGQLGYGFAYRVLDAQYVRVESHPRAVPQRRRRVFVVGHSGGQWHRAAAVLFERASLCGHPAPSREAGQVAPTIPSRSTAGGGLGTDFDCDGGTICVATGQAGAEICADMSPTLNCNHEAPYVAAPVSFAIQAGALRTNPASGPGGVGVQADHAYTLEARAEVQAVAVALRGREGGATAELGDEVQNCLRASSGGGDKPHVLTAMRVRRLTPLECERLMGFPDGHTGAPHKGKPAADGPRYKALGNSWAVNVAAWVGQRIMEVDAICSRANPAA